MKKFITFAAIAFAALAMVSCEKKDGDEGSTAAVEKRIKTFSLVGDGWADVYQYTYDDSGKLIKVYREESKQWSFAYNGSEVTIKNAEGNTAYTLTLNAEGYCEKMVDEWGDERTYAYNSKGQITEIKKNGTVVSTLTIEDGCIVTWTREKDGELQTKIHTYMSTKNLGSIHNIRSEATDPGQWLYEAGFFGKGTTYLCSSSQWQHSDAKATYTYEYDEDGYVTKELKDYPDYPETFEYSWEVVE